MSSTGALPSSAGRLDAIDALRGLAIAAVVAHHISWRMLARGTLEAPGGPLFAAVYLVSEFGVPLFVAVSAFTLAWRPSGYLEMLARRSRRILPAYVLWSLVSLAARDFALLEPAGIGRSLVFGTADVQFYYVPMLLELLLLWPLLRPLLVRRTIGGAAVVLVAAAVFAELAWRGIVEPHWTPLVYYAIPVATGAALPLVLFRERTRFALAGVLLAMAAAAAAASVSGFLAHDGGFAREQAVTSCALTFALALVADRVAHSRAGRLLASLGRSSYGVYLLHLLVASTFVYRTLQLDTLAAASAPVAAIGLAATWAATLGLSWLVADVLGRHRWTAWTVGRQAAN